MILHKYLVRSPPPGGYSQWQSQTVARREGKCRAPANNQFTLHLCTNDHPISSWHNLAKCLTKNSILFKPDKAKVCISLLLPSITLKPNSLRQVWRRMNNMPLEASRPLCSNSPKPHNWSIWHGHTVRVVLDLRKASGGYNCLKMSDFHKGFFYARKFLSDKKQDISQ